MKTVKLSTEVDTKILAKKLASLLEPRSIVTITGDLGVGKTTFTKGLGEGLGVKRTINSPTFTIVKSYRGDINLHHIDAYRLEHSDEDIGFDEYFFDDAITVVEWPQFIETYLPADRLELVLERLSDEERLLTMKPRGLFYEKVCKELTS